MRFEEVAEKAWEYVRSIKSNNAILKDEITVVSTLFNGADERRFIKIAKGSKVRIMPYDKNTFMRMLRQFNPPIEGFSGERKLDVPIPCLVKHELIPRENGPIYISKKNIDINEG